MNATTEAPTKRIESLTAHVAPELAAEIRRLAEDGNRSVSREVAAALRAHIEREASGHVRRLPKRDWLAPWHLP